MIWEIFCVDVIAYAQPAAVVVVDVVVVVVVVDVVVSIAIVDAKW